MFWFWTLNKQVDSLVPPNKALVKILRWSPGAACRLLLPRDGLNAEHSFIMLYIVSYVM